MSTSPCPICEDAGLRIVTRPDGTRVAEECVCRTARRSTRLIERARIPERYANCFLDNFDTEFPSADISLKTALRTARSFVKTYPIETNGKGLLLVGTVGTGKTHLATGVLKALIGKGAEGVFYYCPDLYKDLKNSYERKVDKTEREVLAPVFRADVLVLDEIGQSSPSDWLMDTITHIINMRYNDNKTTIVTTNYPNLPPAAATVRDAWAVMRPDTLGDRIGERLRSRLQEMCVVIEMQGPDFRSTVKRATFATSHMQSHSLSVPVNEEIVPTNSGPYEVQEIRGDDANISRPGVTPSKIQFPSVSREVVSMARKLSHDIPSDHVWTDEDIKRAGELAALAINKAGRKND